MIDGIVVSGKNLVRLAIRRYPGVALTVRPDGDYDVGGTLDDVIKLHAAIRRLDAKPGARKEADA